MNMPLNLKQAMNSSVSYERILLNTVCILKISGIILTRCQNDAKIIKYITSWLTLIDGRVK